MRAFTSIVCKLMMIFCLVGCQAIYKPSPEYIDSPARNYRADNPYWVTNYRLNSSNYFGNPAANNPGLYNG